MDNNKLIIILLVIIILCICVIGLMLSGTMFREVSYLNIENKDISQGEYLTVVLSDDDGIFISNGTVNIKFVDPEGNIVEKNITTNSEGKGNLKLETEGIYNIECNFEGNSKYLPCAISQEVNVKKATTEVISQDQTSSAEHTSKYAPDGSIYPEYGPDVDSQGITREYAQANNMNYIEMTIDGDRPGEYETIGGYVSYDPVAGCYHT